MRKLYKFVWFYDHPPSNETQGIERWHVYCHLQVTTGTAIFDDWDTSAKVVWPGQEEVTYDRRPSEYVESLLFTPVLKGDDELSCEAITEQIRDADRSDGTIQGRSEIGYRDYYPREAFAEDHTNYNIEM